jgi:hypothetical protein
MKAIKEFLIFAILVGLILIILLPDFGLFSKNELVILQITVVAFLIALTQTVSSIAFGNKKLKILSRNILLSALGLSIYLSFFWIAHLITTRINFEVVNLQRVFFFLLYIGGATIGYDIARNLSSLSKILFELDENSDL